MPIIEKPSEDSPLSPGDILRGIELYATTGWWTGESVEAHLEKDDMCMVLSRPCNLVNKKQIIVCGIEPYADNLPKTGLDTFDQQLRFFTAMRDGERMPDLFYLGFLPERQGRFVARFDVICTIMLPPEQELLKEFLTTNRVARLTPDFQRDVHQRLFRAFASLGFDDDSWMCDDDLKLLIRKGRQQLSALAGPIEEAKFTRENKLSKGEALEKNFDKNLANSQKEFDELRASIQLYEAELVRRGLQLN